MKQGPIHKLHMSEAIPVDKPTSQPTASQHCRIISEQCKLYNELNWDRQTKRSSSRCCDGLDRHGRPVLVVGRQWWALSVGQVDQTSKSLVYGQDGVVVCVIGVGVELTDCSDWVWSSSLRAAGFASKSK